MARPTWTLTGPLSAPHGAVLAGTEITLSLVPGVSRDPSGSDLRAGSTVAVVGADGTLTVKGTGDPVMLLASSPDAPVHYRLSCIPRVLPTVTFTAPEGGSLALDDIVPEVPAPIPAVDASTLRAEWQAALAAHTHPLADVTDAGTAAAADVGDFATAAQGAKADAALQPNTVTGMLAGNGTTTTGRTITGTADEITVTNGSGASGNPTLSLALTAAKVGALPIPDPGSFYPTDTITGALQLIGGRERYGTGSPEGVVTAPVGTYYTDTALTNGAMRWAKKTGTGNTGWQCVEGDTGLRSISSLLKNGWTGQAYIRRVGSTIDLRLDSLNASAASSGVPLTLPSGFALTGGIVHRSLFYTSALVTRRASTFTDITIVGYAPSDVLNSSMCGLTGDAWPTTLPGVAA